MQTIRSIILVSGRAGLCCLVVLGVLRGQDTPPGSEPADEDPKIEVAGRVLGPDGAPSPGACVSPFWVCKDGAPQFEDDALRTDARGTFRGKVSVWTDPFALVAYSKDGRLAGFVERTKTSVGETVIRLGPAVHVKARITSDSEGRKPVAWFNSYWATCRKSLGQHALDLIRRNRNDERIRIAMAPSESGVLDVVLPLGSYDYDLYDQDFVSTAWHVVVPADKTEVDLGVIVLPPSFLARHDGKELPEWRVAAARGVDPKKNRISDFRGKWLLVEFWGFW